MFRVPLESFADHGLFSLERFEEEGRAFMSPHYHIGNDDIWGVTAAILAQLANVACDAGLDLQRDWKPSV